MLTRLLRRSTHRPDSPADTPAGAPAATQADQGAPSAGRRWSRHLRHGLVAATVVAVAGTTIGAVFTEQDGTAADGSTDSASALGEITGDEALADRLTERGDSASRSDRRDATDPAKAAALAPSDAQAVTRAVDIAQQDPKSIARSLMGEFGFAASEFSCLEQLWEKESGWSATAANPTSSAYGIPQALPGSKMASAGSDWENNPATQIRWGLGYIQDRYGSPCAAWSHSQANNWY